MIETVKKKKLRTFLPVGQKHWKLSTGPKRSGTGQGGDQTELQPTPDQQGCAEAVNNNFYKISKYRVSQLREQEKAVGSWWAPGMGVKAKREMRLFLGISRPP